MASLAKINILFKANLSEFSSEMQNAQREMEKAGKKMQAIGKSMSAYITAPLVALGGFSSKISMDFDDSMRKVMATSNATAEEFDKLKSTAEQMGAQTRYTASQAAEAMNYMALAGWKAVDVIEGIPGMLQLAAASGEDLGMVADILTDGLTAMGKSAKDAGEFVDVLAATASNSNTTVGMLGQAFAYAAPLAGALGFEVQDLTFAIGLMSNAGIKGEKSGTALRSILTRLVKPTRESKKALEDLGIVVSNANGSIRPLAEIIGDLRLKFSNLNDSQRAQYAAMLAGQEALSGFLALVNAGQNDFDALSSAINNSAGTAQRMSEQMEGGIGGSFREMKSALEGVSIQIGEVLAPAFKEVTLVIKNFSNWFMGLSDETKKYIVIVGSLVAAIGPVLIAFGAIIKLLPLIASAFLAVKAAVVAFNVALAANPIGLAIALFTGLASSILLAELGFKSIVSTQANLKAISKDVAKATSVQITELNKLVRTARDVNEVDKVRIEAVKKINELSPEYLGNITKETIGTDKATTAINRYVDAIKNKAEQQAIASKREELYVALLEKESAPIKGGFDFGDDNIVRSKEDLEKYLEKLGDHQTAIGLIRADYTQLIDKRDKDVDKIKEQIAYMDKLGELKKEHADIISNGVKSGYYEKGPSFNMFSDYDSSKQIVEQNTVTKKEGDSNKFLKGSIGQYEAEIQALSKLRESTAVTTEEYLKFGEQITALEQKIIALTGVREKATSIEMNFTPVIEGSIAALERQKVSLEKQMQVIRDWGGEFSMEYRALKESLIDIDFKIEAKINKESFDSVSQSVNNLKDSMETQSKIASGVLLQKQEEARMYSEIVGGAFNDLSQNFVNSMGEAEDGLARFGQAVAGTILKLISMALSNAMANAIVGATQSGNATGPAAVFTTPAFIATAIAGILGAFASIPKFADGGIVSGPTFGLMGEYAGAANNPEVIAPLNKLKDLIEPASNSGVTQITLGGGFVLNGRDLQLVLDRNSTRSKRIG